MWTVSRFLSSQTTYCLQRLVLRFIAQTLIFWTKMDNFHYDGLFFRNRLNRTHEVVVPGTVCWDHKEMKETIGEQHLDLFTMRRQIAFWIVPFVRIRPAPLKTGRSQFVSRQTDGADSDYLQTKDNKPT